MATILLANYIFIQRKNNTVWKKMKKRLLYLWACRRLTNIDVHTDVHHNEEQKQLSHFLMSIYQDLFCGPNILAYVCIHQVCISTHSGIAPELSHLSCPHGHQKGLPHLHLEHFPNKDLSWPAGQSAVIDDCSFKVVQQCLEMENQLEGAGDRNTKRVGIYEWNYAYYYLLKYVQFVHT